MRVLELVIWNVLTWSVCIVSSAESFSSETLNRIKKNNDRRHYGWGGHGEYGGYGHHGHHHHHSHHHHGYHSYDYGHRWGKK